MILLPLLENDPFRDWQKNGVTNCVNLQLTPADLDGIAMAIRKTGAGSGTFAPEQELEVA
jgi:hypothetical protein